MRRKNEVPCEPRPVLREASQAEAHDPPEGRLEHRLIGTECSKRGGHRTNEMGLPTDWPDANFHLRERQGFKLA